MLLESGGFMAYLYIDDGDAESEDYSNNYVYFNGQDPAGIQKMTALAQTLASLPREMKRKMMDRIQMGAMAV